MMRFVSLSTADNFAYERVLEEGKDGSTVYLDFGCFFGIDLRKLIIDGYPADRTYGVDVHDFIHIANKLFPTEIATHFLTDNILDASFVSGTSELAKLKGKFHHIYVGSVFHLFDWQLQEELARRLGSLWNKEVKGKGVIFGMQRGNPDGEEGIVDPSKNPGQHMMAHSIHAHTPSSWNKLWKEVVFPNDENVVVEARYTTIWLNAGWLIWAIYNN